MCKVRSPICWIGGKSFMANAIISRFPFHQTYVELFGGGGVILLNKPPSHVEVYNDINKNFVNFYRVIRDKEKFNKFFEIINLMPYARTEYYDALNSLEEGNDVDRAIKFFIVGRMSFGGKFGKGWGYKKFTSANGISGGVNAWMTSIEGLPYIANRLRKVQVDNREYKVMLDTFNDPQVFIYADPPYLNTLSDGYGSYELWTETEHKEFLTQCLNSKSKIMISGYPLELYDDILSTWERVEFEKPLTIQKKDKKSSVTEVLWMNYKINRTIAEFEV